MRDSVVVFSGRLDLVQLSLSNRSLVYDRDDCSAGLSKLDTLFVEVNDQGFSGAGGAKEAAAQANITLAC